MSIDAFLNAQFQGGEMRLELRFRDAVQQRRLLDNLMSETIAYREYLINRVLNWRKFASSSCWHKIEANNCNSIGELFNIFPRARETVKVIQIRKGAKEGGRGQLSVADNHTALPGAFNLKHFNDGT
jgi:hypothetical protein